MSDIANQILHEADAGYVRIIRLGDTLDLTVPAIEWMGVPKGNVPANIVDLVRQHKPALLEEIPRGFTWYRGALFRTGGPDPRDACYASAAARGFPSDDPMLTRERRAERWRKFTATGEILKVWAAFLKLDYVEVERVAPGQEMRGAA